jgi:hypothetical protein
MGLQSVCGKSRRRQKTTTKVLKRERADAEEGARQEDLPTYLPTYQSIDLPNLLTCLQNQTSRLCFFGGSVLWCRQKWLYYPIGNLARFGYKLNVKIVYRKKILLVWALATYLNHV